MLRAMGIGAAFVLVTMTTARPQQAPILPPIWSSKPDVNAFEAMENQHLASAQRAIDQLTAMKGARTIENTLVPFDKAVQELDTTANLASLMQYLHPDATFRDRATQMVRKASAAQTALSLNSGVYKALTSLNVSGADAATRYYVQHELLEFKLAGVDKDEATRAELKKLNDQLTADQSAWERNIADGRKTVEVANASELEGLPQDYIAAHKPGPDGKTTITTEYPDIFPVLRYAKSANLRRRLYIAFNTRAYPKNKAVLEDMMRTRYRIATFVGYPSWADYYAADKMIGSGKNVQAFIDQLSAASKPAMQREYQMVLAAKRKSDPQARDVFDYESSYLREVVRRSDYQFDSQSVRPYLPYNEVKQGILDTAAKLFRLSFRQEQGAPAWDPSVETWDVIDGGKMIGRFYLDMHPRPGKYAHDATSPILDGVRGKQLPEAALMCNFPAPTTTDPGLMDIDDVTTFFHEFGHLIHHIVAQQEWAGISGITTEQDFVEAPSQMLEEWIHSPQVLSTFAKNYKTGEAIPAALVAKMNRAMAFGRAFYVTQQIAFAAISYDMFKGNPDEIDPATVSLGDLRRFLPTKNTPESADMFASFDHLAGYSSAYYTYMWDLVIAQDFFQQFNHKDLFAGDAPQRYRRQVLEPGGSTAGNELVRNFLGRPQNMDAFRKWMEQEFQDSPVPVKTSAQ